MSEVIDTRQAALPEHPPVALAYRAMLDNDSVVIIVDNPEPLKSLHQMGHNLGFDVRELKKDDGIYVYIQKAARETEVTKHLVLLFDSATQVFLAEKLLKQAALEHKVIPTPREISSDCGLSIRIPQQAFERVREVLDKRVTVREHHPA